MVYRSIRTEDILQYIDLDETVADDTYIKVLLDAAISYVETQTDRVYEVPATGTARMFDALADVSERRLWLDTDLYTLQSVTNGDGTSVALSDIQTHPLNATPITALQLKSGSGVTWTYSGSHEGAISVTGLWAFSETPPHQIKHAILVLAKYMYRQSSNDNLDRPVQSLDGTTLLPAALPADVEKIIKRYKRLPMPRRAVYGV